jgi:hypothetical protein
MLGPWLGFLALFWATAAASRDQWGKTEPIILSKPTAVEGFVAARFLGTFLATIVGLTLILLAAVVAQAVAAGRLPSLTAPSLRVAAALPGLFYLAALGFTVTLLLRSTLAAAAAALYWVLVMAAGDYLARVFNVALPQNGLIYGCAGVGVFLLGLLLYRRQDRVHRGWARLLGVATAAGFLGAVAAAVAIAARSHDPPLHQDELAIAIAGQRMQRGERAPGFWLPDQNGRPFGLHLVEDRILVIAFWSPEMPESAAALEGLAAVERELGARGVTPVAVCLTEDHTASPYFARVDRLRFPMVTDTGARWSQHLQDTTPVGAAYDVSWLPLLVLTDRERRVREVIDDPALMAPERLLPRVNALLKAEPTE